MNADFGARAQSAITKLLGVPFQENADAYARASPITYISPDDPPLLMVHGDGDTLVPFTQSDRMRKAYTRAGLRARLVKVKNANHDFEPVTMWRPTVEPYSAPATRPASLDGRRIGCGTRVALRSVRLTGWKPLRPCSDTRNLV